MVSVQCNLAMDALGCNGRQRDGAIGSARRLAIDLADCIPSRVLFTLLLHHLTEKISMHQQHVCH